MQQTVSKDPNMTQRPKATGVQGAYPAIEAVLAGGAGGDLQGLRASLAEAYDKLEHIIRDRNGFGRSGQAKKASHSIELTVDLLLHLMEIQAQLAKRPKKSDDQNAEQGLKQVAGYRI